MLRMRVRVWRRQQGSLSLFNLESGMSQERGLDLSCTPRQPRALQEHAAPKAAQRKTATPQSSLSPCCKTALRATAAHHLKGGAHTVHARREPPLSSATHLKQ